MSLLSSSAPWIAPCSLAGALACACSSTSSAASGAADAAADAAASADAGSCLTCIPTSTRAGVSYATVQSPWPSNPACLNAEQTTTGIAKEVLMGATKTVIIASPPMEISDATWATYTPSFPNFKNSDRYLLFTSSCFARSPSKPASCTGDACRELVDLDGYTWTALSQVLSADCVPDASHCSGTTAQPGGLVFVVTEKCHEMQFTGSVYYLDGPNGERAVMHATSNGMPTTNVQLPPGWTLHQEALSAPLVVLPFGGGDQCYYNIIRDSLVQSYHQIRYAKAQYP